MFWRNARKQVQENTAGCDYKNKKQKKQAEI